MEEIGLTQDQVALVDDNVYEELNRVKWCAQKGANTFYAIKTFRRNGKSHRITMHHKILGQPPKGYEIDHVNGVGTDNRRENLRFVTVRQNQQNQHTKKKRSKYPGVGWHTQLKKWRTRIQIDGKYKHIGVFSSELDAFQAYKQAVEANGETMI